MPYLWRPDGARLHYRIEGGGPTLLLLHGGTGKGEYDWEFQIPWLVEHYRVVIPDLRAHGRSTDPAGRLSMYVLGEDALALVDHLGGRVAAVMGFSAGGTGLLMCLARQPEISAGIGGIVAVAASLQGAAPDRLPDLAPDRWPKDLSALVHEAWPDPDHWRTLLQVIQRSWLQTTRITAESVSAIRCPILAVSGAKDRAEPPQSSVTLAGWAGDGRCALIPDAGHMVMRHQPQAFRAVVQPFLAEVARPYRPDPD